MSINGCIAMILAGGRGERLGTLTRYYSKPAVHFGGRYRIIDFTLNNCINSGLNTIGILSQYLSGDLHTYIACDRKKDNGGIYMLPPKSKDEYYSGTADAVYKNIGFIEQYEPDCVLVLAGDHIYDMDYRKMIAFHQRNNADVTVASTPVDISEASRFGIINADAGGRVRCFEEKPLHPKSNLASMGIYVFQWDKLKKHLLLDTIGRRTRHDFGRDILPEMLRGGEAIFTYEFGGYWRDVGTVESLWEANIDRINRPFESKPRDREGSHGIALRGSIIDEGCLISGTVEHSVLSDHVTVGKGAQVVDSVVMPGAYIGSNAKVYKTIVGTGAIIMDGAAVGAENGSDFFIDRKVCAKGVSLIAPWLYIGEGMSFQAGSHIHEERLQEWATRTNTLAAMESIHQAENRRREYAFREAVPV